MSNFCISRKKKGRNSKKRTCRKSYSDPCRLISSLEWARKGGVPQGPGEEDDSLHSSLFILRVQEWTWRWWTRAGTVCQTHWELQQERALRADGRHSLHTWGYTRGGLWRCLSVCCLAHKRSFLLPNHNYVEQGCPAPHKYPPKAPNSLPKLLAEDAEKRKFKE